MCVIFDLECQAAEAAQAGAESMLDLVADMIIESISDLVVQWSTWLATLLKASPADLDRATSTNPATVGSLLG